MDRTRIVIADDQVRRTFIARNALSMLNSETRALHPARDVGAALCGVLHEASAEVIECAWILALEPKAIRSHAQAFQHLCEPGVLYKRARASCLL